MPTLTRFPDVHKVLGQAFAGLATGGVFVDTPIDLQQRVPVIQVRRIGGDDDHITDWPRVDVNVYVTKGVAGSHDLANGIAEDCRQILLSTPVRTTEGIVDRMETESGPIEINYTDSTLRLVTATYRIRLRRYH